MLVLTEANLDESFPTSISYRRHWVLDRNGSEVGVLEYTSISSKLLTKHGFPSDFDTLFVELNLCLNKWNILSVLTKEPILFRLRRQNIEQLFELECFISFIYQHDIK